MNSKKKAHPIAATMERAEGTAAFSGAAISDIKSTTDRTEAQGIVSRHLLYGKENAIAGRKLVEIMQLNGIRELTRLVERERQAGAPICATSGRTICGYYLSATPRELEKYIHSLDHRLKAVGKTRQHLNETLDRLTGQSRIEGV